MSKTAAARKGVQTTEFWGKCVVQAVLILNSVFGLRISISDETAMALVCLVEAGYGLMRTLTKRGGA